MSASTVADFTIPLPASIEAPNSMPLDQAIDLACEKLGLPLLGGPSGSGWSKFSTAQRCAHLFRKGHIDVNPLIKLRGGELRIPAAPLQIGGLYHALQALYYAPGLGEAVEHKRGLIAAELWNKRGRPKRLTVPHNAADLLLAELHAMAEVGISEALQASINAAQLANKPGPAIPRKPSAALIVAAEQCFDAHTVYYGDGREDLQPLAIEWHAEHPALGYTCRYDAIMKVGEQHPGGLAPGSVVIYERKTSAWLSEMATEGWFMDGEILGELLNWEPSGCGELFGPLAGVVVDIVTKAKVTKFLQVIVPPTLPTIAEHARWIKYTQGEIAMWEASGVYPKRFTQCFDRWGKCGNWAACVAGEK